MKQSIHLALMATLAFLLAAPSAQAQPSMTGPVKFDNFFVSEGSLFASGRITLPGGSEAGFTTPASVSTLPITAAVEGGSSCTLLSLLLGPLDLNLLGLAVHLDQVNLLVSAEPGPGQLLGNLLCSPKKNNKTFLTDLASSLNSLFSNGNTTLSGVPVSGSTGSFVNTINYEQLATELTEIGVEAGADPCPVLDLRIQELNLMLLGLRVQALAPIALNITAHPGPGNLLGNLLCQLAHLLDSQPATNLTLANSTLSQIMRELTGGILVTLPTRSPLLNPATTPYGGRIDVISGISVAAQPEPTVCTVLSLVLGPVDLDLLGLIVRLERVDLLVTAEPGQNALLGNLLCPQKGNLNATAFTTELRRGLQRLVARPAQATAEGTSVNSAGISPFAELSTAAVCPILHLEIQQLNVFLLGLRIQSRAPIILDVSAQSGPGKLLGNLLCQLAGLLDAACAEPVSPVDVGLGARVSRMRGAG